MVLWLAVITAAAGCYGLKLAGLSLPESLVTHRRAQQSAGLLPVAMLRAPSSPTLDNDRHHRRLAHLAGSRSRLDRLWRKRSLIVVFLIATTNHRRPRNAPRTLLTQIEIVAAAGPYGMPAQA
jgi:hypothetical protein